MPSSNDFRDLESLGSGGFGEVFRVEGISDGEQFARKVLVDTSDEAVARFKKEVRLLSSLDHPRIVRVVSIQLTEPPFSYVMPLYPRSLRQELSRLAGDERRISRIFEAILEGIDYAHEQGVVHRDLKPENVLYRTDDDLAISDFGLGRLVTSDSTRVTRTGESLGTMAYMAPEQIRNARDADFRSDIFSLGRMLYEMLTGDCLGVQDTSSLPVGLARIVNRCTRSDPAGRFQQIADLRAAFRSVTAARDRTSEEERVRALIAESLTRTALPAGEAAQFADALVAVQQDSDLIHKVFMELPVEAIRALWDASPEVTDSLTASFLNHVVSQGWAFAYTDRIANACERLFRAIPDAALRGRIICATLELGIEHNRWYVIGVAVGFLNSPLASTAEARALANALHPCRERIRQVAERIDRANPAIRELLAGDEFD